MAIKFQYNKTSLQMLEKQLKVRKRTLPIIKSKESALRMEVKKCKDDLVRLEQELEEGIGRYESMFALWNEFNPGLVRVKDVHLTVRKIAGTRSWEDQKIYWHCSGKRDGPVSCKRERVFSIGGDAA